MPTKIIKATDYCNASMIHSFNLAINSYKSKQFPVENDLLGPARHFSLFPCQTVTKDLSPDGYYNPSKEFELDQSFYPSRLWKGGLIKYEPQNPLRIHQKVRQELTLNDIKIKETSRGKGIFTVEDRTIFNQFGKSVQEQRTLVYLENGLGKMKSVSRDLKADYTTSVTPSDVMLFRFSAVTFNAHLIHYSKEYAQLEGYPSTLVHGPLVVSLVLDTLQGLIGHENICEFEYSNTFPTFVDEKMTLNFKFIDNFCHVWATNPHSLAFKGTAKLSK
jgi:3-methylfumaryl-CoA hydratase